MDCPRCHIALDHQKHDSAEVEKCSTCGGMLLDQGVLDRIAEPHEGDLEFSTLDGETFSHEDTHGVAGCPRCGGLAMRKVEFNIYTGIILDHCESCRAFWLDGKELDRINDEVRKLDRESGEEVAPGMLWFASFIWSLPR